MLLMRNRAGIARSTRDRLKMTVTDAPVLRRITTFRTLERFEAGRRGEGYSLWNAILQDTHPFIDSAMWVIHGRRIGWPRP